MQTFLFLGAWTLLDVVFNTRYPAPAPLALSLLPSIDVTVLLAGLALCGRYRRAVPASVSWVLGVAVVLVRVYRFADGVTLRYFNRPLDLALDLPLSSELVRLLDSTVSRTNLIPGVLLALAALVGLGALTVRAFRRLERDLSAAQPRALFKAVVLGTLTLSLFAPRDGGRGLRLGAFGASLVPTVAAQTASWLNLKRARTDAESNITAVDGALRRLPRGLEKLHHANVFIFLVESYGETVIARPELAREMAPLYTTLDRSFTEAGFAVASGLLDSPTYAGRSWLAQETLATGIAVTDHVIDARVQERRPMTMARIFRDAGYRTVLVQPGSTHPELARWSYDFDRVYSAWDLGYRGPPFRWAPMPDQFAIDFTHRQEVVAAAQPLLVEYALVSSHAPWSEQPAILSDWESVGDGHVYHTLPTTRFPITWFNLSEGTTAYCHAVAYDLTVLADYITKFVPGDSLVLILGDHQPVAEITGFSASFAVPVHALSRNRALVDTFLARGYDRGMYPRRTEKPPGLETLLPALLADFSVADRGGAPLARSPPR